jgi:hypothetical protein
MADVRESHEDIARRRSITERQTISGALDTKKRRLAERVADGKNSGYGRGLTFPFFAAAELVLNVLTPTLVGGA